MKNSVKKCIVKLQSLSSCAKVRLICGNRLSSSLYMIVSKDYVEEKCVLRHILAGSDNFLIELPFSEMVFDEDLFFRSL